MSEQLARRLTLEETRDAVPWQVPTLATGVAANAFAHLPTASELKKLQKEAYDEAYERGLKEGRVKGAQQARRELLANHRREALRIEEFLDTLGQPITAVTSSVQKELLALVVAIARQVIRRELKTSPDEIVGAVRDALSQLPVASHDVQVELHPEDARLVRERLKDRQAGKKRWTIVEDALVTRGGCRVKTDDSLIDATLEARLGALVARAFGDQREEANGETEGDADARPTQSQGAGGRPGGGEDRRGDRRER